MKNRQRDLERNKKKVYDQQKYIHELKGVIAGHEQLQRINNALVAVLLHQMGADEEHPVTVGRDAVNDALEKLSVRSGFSDGAYAMYCVSNE